MVTFKEYLLSERKKILDPIKDEIYKILIGVNYFRDEDEFDYVLHNLTSNPDKKTLYNLYKEKWIKNDTYSELEKLVA
jgi:hypothetical protein